MSLDGTQTNLSTNNPPLPPHPHPSSSSLPHPPLLPDGWPGNFQPWPLQATELDEDTHMNTAEEIIACKQWLMKKEHRDFKKWAGVKVTNTKAWMDLELVIKTVLGIEGSRAWSASSKAACKEIWEAGSQGAGKHNSVDDNKKIGIRTAELQLEDSKVEWAEEEIRWARLAFVALTPRLNSLAKKSRQAETKKDPSEPTDISPKPLSTGAKPTSSFAAQPPQKRTKISQGQGKSNVSLDSATSNDAPLLHKLSAVCTQPLCNWTIIVHIAGTPEENVAYVAVGVSSIVEDSARGLLDCHILCDHLSWVKFKDLLRDTDKEYDLDSGKRLSWLCTEKRDGKETVFIDDETLFRYAIGSQEWKARQACFYKPLELQMLSRYRPL